MANLWLRLWHDMPNDPKWRTIARVSGQPVSLVVAIYVHLLVDASQSKERGTVRTNSEDIASALDCDTEQVDSVLSAMQGRVIVENKISGWEVRQPDREDGPSSARTGYHFCNYIYYVATTDSDVVKIGISKNPWARVKDLQTGSSKKYTVLATMKTASRSEFSIHSFFTESRKTGEWFSRSAALNLLIEKTKDGTLSEIEECIEFLGSLPKQDFIPTVDSRSYAVTTKDTDTDTDTDKCFTGTNVPVVGEVADMSAEIEKLDDCPQTELLAVFAEELPDLPQPVAWGGNRATNLRTRWKWVLAEQKRKGKPHDKAAGLEFFRRLFGYIAQSNFLMGRAGSWQADLGWIVKAENFAKILQGNYENKEAAA